MASTTAATVSAVEEFKADGRWSSVSTMAGMGSTTDKGRFTLKGNVLKIEGTDGLEDISRVHWVDADHFVLTGEREVQRCRRR